ncbi:MAG: peptidylprolyl isomerase [Candidatus Magasanikbacteria bacterium]|nr:peptidylprolyl isomerase [Candidatus Magasanikbacteria bacterium]
MSKPQHGNTVKIHYTGRLSDGSEFDSSRDREPLSFTIGSHQVVPGFENAILDLKAGESITVTIPAAEAYGEKRPEMIATLEKSRFPENIPVELGIQFQIQAPDGTPMVAEITAIDGDMVTVDANHHLAGKDLTFDIQLVEIV